MALELDPVAAWYAETMQARIEEDSDLVTVITGRERIGKSTLAAWVLQMTEPGARPVDRVGFTPLEYMRLYRSLGRNSTRIGDEWIKAANRKRHSSRGNIEVEEAFQTIGGLQGGHHILVLPRKESLGEYWTENRVDVWMHVVRKGSALIHFPQRDVYGQRETFWAKPEEFGEYKFPRYEPEADWRAYKVKKDAYMMAQAERTLEILETIEHPERAADDALTPQKIAKLVAKDEKFWTSTRGYADKGLIQLEFDLPAKTTESVAKMARSARAKMGA